MANNELDLTFKKFSELEAGATAAAVGDKIIISDVSDGNKVVTRTIQDIVNLALSSGAVLAAVKVTDAATYTVLAANSGKLHIIPDLTADCVISLPTAADGLYYKFIYGGVAEDAHDVTFDTGSDTNFYLGGVTGLDDDDGDILVIYPDGDSNSIMKIDTLNAGSTIELYCDGTNWYVNAVVVSGTDTHTAFSDQS
jgi:hypothetical protein